MNVLIGCECSGVVRRAFAAQGHVAYSCDLQPADDGETEFHLQCNVFDAIQSMDWDLLICHPPCTHLAVSGARWFPEKNKEQKQALEFVIGLFNCGIPMICLENPISVISTKIGKPTQIIHPWQFGHPESKTTCLWLKNLPKLRPTKILKLPEKGVWDNQTPSGQNKLGPSPDRAKLRSVTYRGIAEAMADQWTRRKSRKGFDIFKKRLK